MKLLKRRRQCKSEKFIFQFRWEGASHKTTLRCSAAAPNGGREPLS